MSEENKTPDIQREEVTMPSTPVVKPVVVAQPSKPVSPVIAAEKLKQVITTPTPPVIKKVEFVFDEDTAIGKLNGVKAYYETFIGKTGHNPYIILKDTIQPLTNRFNKGERTESLFNAILSLKETPPVVPIKREDHSIATTSAKFAEDIEGNEPKQSITVQVKT